VGLEDLITELNALESQLVTDFPSTRADVPSQLFHYTGIPALKSIVETGVIWATNIAYLNDSSELAYPHQFFRKFATVFLRTTISHKSTESIWVGASRRSIRSTGRVSTTSCASARMVIC
jgi:hypothetical protein